MALYQINISYDGTDFHGYQRQRNQRSVQGEIETALRMIGWSEASVLSSGRTDAGVHAEQQIAVFCLDWKHSDRELQKAINTSLPNDIAVNDIKKIENTAFHPRYQAVSRTYRYQIYVSEVRLPLLERYHWGIWPTPNFDLMNAAAQEICGKHDFRHFGRPYHKNGRTERIINSANWIRDNRSTDQMIFKIEGNSFLYHMVRRIVYVYIRLGQGKIDIAEVTNALEGIDNLPPGIAPAKGLFLEKIKY